MLKVDNKLRVVAAVVHDDTTEVEIILEITTNVGSLNESSTLQSIWIDCDELYMTRRRRCDENRSEA